MKCGISTACLYPMDTLQCLETTALLTPACVEIFLNTFSELEPDYVEPLSQLQKRCELHIASVHPFSSEMESFFFFTDYETRFQDGLQLYRRYFEICQRLGAKVLVFHGNRSGRTEISMEKYAQRFCRLCAEGEKYGILVAQENVERCQCGHPENIYQLLQYADCPISFVLDLKQALRAQVPPMEMVQAMGAKNICHLHLSDSDAQSDCILPSKGTFDFATLFHTLLCNGYTGDAVVELYRNGYKTPNQLADAANYLQKIADRVKEEKP